MTAATDAQMYMKSNEEAGIKETQELVGPQAEFYRFSESPLWQIQNEILEKGISVHHPIENTYLANVYVDMIVSYWNDMLTAGKIDPTEPLYIFELGAGLGQFSWYMINRLQQKIKETDAGDLKPVYLICDPSMANLEYCRHHPRLKPYIESRCVDLVQWNGYSEEKLYLQNSFKTIESSSIENPVTFIADFHFGRIKQDLFYIHYGKLFNGQICMTEAPEEKTEEADPFSNVLIEYEWQETDGTENIPNRFTKTLKTYVERLNATSLTIPSGALESIQAMKEISRGSMMLLSSDNGYFKEKDLNLRAEPELSLFGALYLPVNYHCLNRFAETTGGFTHTSQAAQDDILFSTMVFDNTVYSGQTEQELPDVRKTSQYHFGDTNPTDRYTTTSFLSNFTKSLSPYGMLACLKQSSYDPAAAAQIFPAFYNLRPELTPDERLEWISALDKVWSNVYPTGETLDFIFGTGLLAIDLGAWEAAIDIFRTMVSMTDNDPACLYNLGFASLNTGDMESAKLWLENSLKAAPDNSQAQLLLNDIIRWEKEWVETGWYDRDLCRNESVRLVPLGPEHTGQLFYQYRDRSIGILTRLPDFTNESDVRLWIENERKDKKKALFAVFHQNSGFSGVVSMSMLNDTGYFYFWTGADYQGQGIGQKAVACMIKAMKELCNINTVYTSVYIDNIKSQTALVLLDFDRLPFQAKEPDEDVMFYRHGMMIEADKAYGELKNLLEETVSPMVLR